MVKKLDDRMLSQMDATGVLQTMSVGQICSWNPLKEPLKREDVKPRLVGHWGTTPGLNFLYVHLQPSSSESRISNMIFIIGPGHGGPAAVAPCVSGGHLYRGLPETSQDQEGMQRLFKQFSFPGGIPSHVAPETPGRSMKVESWVRARHMPMGPLSTIPI